VGRSRDLFGEVPMSIFGNNVAIVLWGRPARLILIRNPGIAETFRRQFEAIWSLATPVPDDVYKFNCKQKTQKVLDQAGKAGKKK